MSVQTPRREPLVVPPGAQTRTRVGTALHAQGAPAGLRHAKANCGFCGEAWFGDVAYCPYCGRPSASAPVPTASDTPPEADFDRFDGPTHALASDGRSSADPMRAGTMGLIGAPAGARADRPGMDWKPWAKAIALATVLAAVMFGGVELVGTGSDRPGPQDAVRAPGGDAARSGTVEASAGGAASAPGVPAAPAAPAVPAVPAGPAVPRADIEPPAQQQAPAPPARNRSLCSAANEAAGLCNPQ